MAHEMITLGDHMEFVKTMLEEKGLNLNTDMTQEHINLTYWDLLKFIDKQPRELQKKIKDTFSLIDFRNGDVMDYVKHLSQGMLRALGY